MTYYEPDEIKDNAITAFQEICDILHPRLLCGQAFEITVSTGSHQYYAEGTFVSSAWSDEQGWQFFIDVPEYRGRKIRYLTWDDHQWLLRLEDDEAYVEQWLNENDDGQEECEIVAALYSHRFVQVTSIDFKGL